MRTLGCLLAFAIGASVALAQQAGPPIQVIQTAPGVPGQVPALPEKGSGLVLGQVVDARGAAVAGAVVTLQGGWQPIALTTVNRDMAGGPRFSLTSSDGHFAFFELTPGSYAFEANKPGFLSGAYGRVRPGGSPQSIELTDGEHQASIRIVMWEYGSISGTIRDETGEAVVGLPVRALRRAVVGGRRVWTSAPASTTNDRGEYRIDSLPAGQYVVVVAATQTALPPLPPQEAQLQLMRAGVSFSTVDGARPIGDFLWNSGGRSAMTVPDPADDGRISVYATTFYPSVRSVREAEVITLESGQERLAVDLQLRLQPAPVVSGTVSGPDGPMGGITVHLVPEYAQDLSGDLTGLETAVTFTDPKGQFLFIGVPVGQYFVVGELLPPTAALPAGGAVTAAPTHGAWINQPLTVGENGATGLALTLHPGVKVSGQIAFDGAKTPPPPELIQRFFVSLEPIDFAVNRQEAPYMVNFDKNGQFVFPFVPPGRYTVLFRAGVPERRAMPDWTTKGATLEGRDVSDRPMIVANDVDGVVMTLTDHNSEMTGTIRDAAGKIDPTAAVVMFTTDRELWPILRAVNRRIRAVRASETGAFSIKGVPPGDYFIAAIPDADMADFADPRMLDAVSKFATRFSMASGERKTQELVVRSIR